MVNGFAWIIVLPALVVAQLDDDTVAAALSEVASGSWWKGDDFQKWVNEAKKVESPTSWFKDTDAQKWLDSALESNDMTWNEEDAKKWVDEGSKMVTDKASVMVKDAEAKKWIEEGSKIVGADLEKALKDVEKAVGDGKLGDVLNDNAVQQWVAEGSKMVNEQVNAMMQSEEGKKWMADGSNLVGTDLQNAVSSVQGADLQALLAQVEGAQKSGGSFLAKAILDADAKIVNLMKLKMRAPQLLQKMQQMDVVQKAVELVQNAQRLQVPESIDIASVKIEKLSDMVQASIADAAAAIPSLKATFKSAVDAQQLQKATDFTRNVATELLGSENVALFELRWQDVTGGKLRRLDDGKSFDVALIIEPLREASASVVAAYNTLSGATAASSAYGLPASITLATAVALMWWF